MNTKQKNFIENMKLAKPALWFEFVNTNRKLYNALCRPCQVLVVQHGGNIKPRDLCEGCRETYKTYTKQLSEIIEKSGGKVGVK